MTREEAAQMIVYLGMPNLSAGYATTMKQAILALTAPPAAPTPRDDESERGEFNRVFGSMGFAGMVDIVKLHEFSWRLWQAARRGKR